MPATRCQVTSEFSTRREVGGDGEVAHPAQPKQLLAPGMGGLGEPVEEKHELSVVGAGYESVEGEIAHVDLLGCDGDRLIATLFDVVRLEAGYADGWLETHPTGAAP